MNESFFKRGVFGALDIALKKLYYVALFSQINDRKTEDCSDFSEVTKETLELFSNIDENSTSDECVKVLNQMTELNEKDLLLVKSMMNKTKCLEFYGDTKRFRNQIKKLIAEPTNVWFKLKWMEMNYARELERLDEEVSTLQLELEESSRRTNKDKNVLTRTNVSDDNERKQMETITFQAKHPQLIRANIEEEIEFIQLMNEGKLKKYRLKEGIAEKNFRNATLYYRSSTQALIEETLNTKTFFEWLKEKSDERQKELNELQEDIWRDLSSELESCRNQCIKYIELDKLYNGILRERQKEAEKKMIAAVIVLQAYWRAYLSRKALKQN